MNDPPNILVVTDSPSDATLIGEILSGEFDNVSTSTEPRCAVGDFEEARPALLVLGFNTLDKAESYYTELKRESLLAQTLPRQTLILCGQKDVLRVCELCKQQRFDDYVLFWPVTNDPGRLSTAVNRALREISKATATHYNEGLTQTHNTDESELSTAEHVVRADRQPERPPRNSSRPSRQADKVTAESAGNPLNAGMGSRIHEEDPSARQQGSAVEKIESSDGSLSDTSSASRSMRPSGDTGRRAPAAESARAIREFAASIRPLLLIIDDDEFQHELLRQLFAREGFELAFSTTSAEALSLMGTRRPDLILMDIDLPDVDGVEITRQLKSIRRFADIPIVMMTGHGEQAVVIASKSAGAADYVVKPFARGTMLTKVRRLLNVEAALDRAAVKGNAVDGW